MIWRKASRADISTAFTLIELLVVVAIIAVLAALLLPVLARAKEAGRKTQCINNAKQMELMAHLYATDNNDFLVSCSGWGYTGSGRFGGLYLVPAWVAGIITETDAACLVDPQYAAFAVYNKNAAIYRCPDDVTVNNQNGTNFPRLRSYSLNITLGWYSRNMDDPSFEVFPMIRHKVSEVLNPGPARQFAFLEEHPNTINGVSFQLDGYLYGFWQLPGSYHNGSGVLSFVDGHVEAHYWVDPRTKRPLTPVSYGPLTTETIEPNGPDPVWLHSRSVSPVLGWTSP